MKIKIEGAEQAFDLCWDSDGLVHVFAANKADAFRGMGYAAGYERLWQIHLSTLFATGTAASVMGPRYIAQDLMHRAFKVPAYDMPESSGDWIVDAYLEGLNSYVRGLKEVPPEFERAGTMPREFTRHDIASRHRFTGWFQHKTFMEKIYMGKLMARHGTEWFKGHVHRFSEADERSIDELRDGLNAMDAGVGRLLFPKQDILSGSNNWAVRGELSASGKPMLATDPHQAHTIPNTFFYVHLSTPDWDTFGATFPGVPYFMMGFNRDVSWGLTTGFIDTFDVFVEKGEPQLTESIAIEVAGQETSLFDIALSEHGPILESLSDSLGLTEKTARKYCTSLNWVMRDIPTSAGTLATMPLATSSKELGEALFENDISPLVNNIISVDKDNNLDRYIAATMRKRVAVTGTVPLPAWGSSTEFELTKASDLRPEHNPECGYSLTANNDTIGEDGEFPIHNFPILDARARRIRELLELKGRDFTSKDFEQMQLDTVDLWAKDCVPGILSCMTKPSSQVQRAKKILESWGYNASTESQAACIFYPLMDSKWHIQFMHQVLKDDLLLSLSAVAPSLNRFSIAEFFKADSPWCAHRKTLEHIICDEVEQLLDNLDREFGQDWNWGEIHQVSFKHSLSKFSHWGDMKAGPDPVAGSSSTLQMAMHLKTDESSEILRVYHGPAFRWVVDMADPLHFRFVIAGGNSGLADSTHFSDHYTSWLTGQYRNVSLVRAEIQIEKLIEVDSI